MDFTFLTKYFDDVHAYQEDLQLVAKYLEAHELEVPESIKDTFWNHMVCALERLRLDTQNDLEIPVDHGMSDEALKHASALAKQLESELHKPMLDFEIFLLAIYFEQIQSGKGE